MLLLDYFFTLIQFSLIHAQVTPLIIFPDSEVGCQNHSHSLSQSAAPSEKLVAVNVKCPFVRVAASLLTDTADVNDEFRNADGIRD